MKAPWGVCYDDSRGGNATMNLMRFTIVGNDRSISFVYDGKALDALIRACSDSPLTLSDFLAAMARREPTVLDYVTCGLAVFDEHNAEGAYEPIHEAIEHFPSDKWPVFRVVDDITREGSLRSTRTGVIV